MAKRPKRDRYTSLVVDRHGRQRCRFRHNGVDCYLPHREHPDYKAAYELALAQSAGVVGVGPRAIPRSVNALLPLYYRSIKFKRGGDEWRATRRRVLEDFAKEFGNDLVGDFRAKDIDAILGAKLEKQKVGKRTVGGTSAALRLREQLDLLFKFAVKQEWIATNPVEHSEEVEHKGAGFYPWNEDDIATFRAYWPLGTKPRLAMELVLWTGARRGDAHRAAPPRNGRVVFTAAKTAKEQDVPVAPMLQSAIEAMPSVGITTLLVTDYGKPFSRAGFGNWFKDKCLKAGLPRCTLHGLRKALARRSADLNASQQQLKALGQWSGDREVAIYIEGANRKQLAADALADVIAWEGAQKIVQPRDV